MQPFYTLVFGRVGEFVPRRDAFSGDSADDQTPVLLNPGLREKFRGCAQINFVQNSA